MARSTGSTQSPSHKQEKCLLSLHSLSSIFIFQIFCAKAIKVIVGPLHFLLMPGKERYWTFRSTSISRSRFDKIKTSVIIFFGDVPILLLMQKHPQYWPLSIKIDIFRQPPFPCRILQISYVSYIEENVTFRVQNKLAKYV